MNAMYDECKRMARCWNITTSAMLACACVAMLFGGDDTWYFTAIWLMTGALFCQMREAAWTRRGRDMLEDREQEPHQ